jgi:hypothetical protein
MFKRINSFIVTSVTGEVVFDVQGETVEIITEKDSAVILIEDLVQIAETIKKISN